MALGLAVTSTNHSGIPELVIDRKSGLLVDEKSAEQLEEAITYFVEHPEKIAEMRIVGRRIVDGEFNIDTLNYKLVDIYIQLITKNNTQYFERDEEGNVFLPWFRKDCNRWLKI